ncbi:MAG: hypothetical protein LBU73_09140 [Helicobacteraceae bacterium]|jgi:hypothetical protein|nr:hypothetical protein [Helicobacteraceae bacterium]
MNKLLLALIIACDLFAAKITFFYGGAEGMKSERHINDGEILECPKDPTIGMLKGGFFVGASEPKFARWLNDADGKPYDFAKPVKGDLVLRAEWIGAYFAKLKDALDCANGKKPQNCPKNENGLNVYLYSKAILPPSAESDWIVKKIALIGVGAERQIAIDKNGYMFRIAEKGELSLKGNISLVGRKNSEHSLVFVAGGAFVMTRGAKITGNIARNESCSAVAIKDGGAFKMTGGLIVGNSTGSRDPARGAVCSYGGDFAMTGGKIENNKYGDLYVEKGAARVGGDALIGFLTLAARKGEVAKVAADSNWSGLVRSANLLGDDDALDEAKKLMRDQQFFTGFSPRKIHPGGVFTAHKPANALKISGYGLDNNGFFRFPIRIVGSDGAIKASFAENDLLSAANKALSGDRIEVLTNAESAPIIIENARVITIKGAGDPAKIIKRQNRAEPLITLRHSEAKLILDGNLTLNGGVAQSPLISVQSGSLNIKNHIKITGNRANATSVLHIGSEGEFRMQGGEIAHNFAPRSAIYSLGKVYLDGGKIVENTGGDLYAGGNFAELSGNTQLDLVTLHAGSKLKFGNGGWKGKLLKLSFASGSGFAPMNAWRGEVVCEGGGENEIAALNKAMQEGCFYYENECMVKLNANMPQPLKIAKDGRLE